MSAAPSAADLAVFLAVLRDSWRIETGPGGRSAYRRDIETIDGRRPANPVMIDLCSAAALSWLLAETADSRPRRSTRSGADRHRLALERLTFSVAECVWLTEQGAQGHRYAVRVEPDGRDGYVLRSVELGR